MKKTQFYQGITNLVVERLLSFCVLHVWSFFLLRDLVLRFPAPVQSLPPANGPEQKRPAYPCKFFAQGRCTKGNSCRFLHVNENMNRTSQQQVVNNMAGTSGIQSIEGM